MCHRNDFYILKKIIESCSETSSDFNDNKERNLKNTTVLTRMSIYMRRKTDRKSNCYL